MLAGCVVFPIEVTVEGGASRVASDIGAGGSGCCVVIADGGGGGRAVGAVDGPFR